MAPVSVRELLDVWKENDTSAAPGRLEASIYAEMRRIAHRELGRLRPGDTLGTTALVHEAYVRLAEGVPGWADDRHVLATSALAMRQILIDHCRRRGARKRGAEIEKVGLEIADEKAPRPDAEGRAIDVLALEAALRKLAAVEVRLAKLVILRFYGGLTLEESADCLEVSTRTAKRYWRKARVLLWKILADTGEDDE